ncbi:MAG: hypothetical protein HY817_02100 [Candidatus Abawacabacteria bacterium]|nr:hypothetical protein [Candidatus Abawacabacteria bacterium]
MLKITESATGHHGAIDNLAREATIWRQSRAAMREAMLLRLYEMTYNIEGWLDQIDSILNNLMGKALNLVETAELGLLAAELQRIYLALSTDLDELYGQYKPISIIEVGSELAASKLHPTRAEMWQKYSQRLAEAASKLRALVEKRAIAVTADVDSFSLLTEAATSVLKVRALLAHYFEIA